MSDATRFYQKRVGGLSLILDKQTPGRCIACPDELYGYVLDALNRADRAGSPAPDESLLELGQMLLHEKQTVARRDRELADLRQASIDVLPQKHLERFKRRSLELMAKSAALFGAAVGETAAPQEGPHPVWGFCGASDTKTCGVCGHTEPA